MPSWDEIRAHLLHRHAVVSDGAHGVGLVRRFRPPETAAALEQRIKVERAVAHDSDWILIRAAVCAAHRIDAPSALRWNALHAVGTLAIDGAYCILRTALGLDSLTLRDLDRALEVIARVAVGMRDRARTAPETLPFTPYED